MNKTVTIELSEIDYNILKFLIKSYPKDTMSTLIHEAIRSIYYTPKNLKKAGYIK